MTAPATPTEAEAAEIAAVVAELREHGYQDLDEYVYPRSGLVLRVGTRVRRQVEEYPEALRRGTGNVVALLHKPGSSWSRKYGIPDVEMVMLSDTARFGSRLSQLAQYHVAVMEED